MTHHGTTLLIGRQAWYAPGDPQWYATSIEREQK